MTLKGIITVIRVPFLLLALILGILGAAVAWYEARLFGSPFHSGYALLATFGLLVAHAAVNIFNDYFDARSGLDYKTRRTPFSGGSGAAPEGLLTVGEVLWLGLGCIVILVPIAVFFVVKSGLMLLPLLVIALLLIIFYTPVILKTPWPEWSPGLGLGILPVLGAYFVHTGHYSLNALVASMPSFFLVHNLLLLNEFRMRRRMSLPAADRRRSSRKEKSAWFFRWSPWRLMCGFLSCLFRFMPLYAGCVGFPWPSKSSGIIFL